jgi:FMN phosphatase YigB (HAD superfamily)
MVDKRQPVFLLDVDDTLLDNDRLEQDLKDHLDKVFGVDCRKHYWDIFEALRDELGYADYLGALQRYRLEHTRNPRILELSSFLINYRFANRLYPGALDTIKRLRSHGQPVVLSDGDAVFQPRKIERSGIWKAVRGRVLIYIHKEQMLDDVAQKYPADHYFMVDDKVRILAAMKKVWGERLTTVFVKQGHYAMDQAAVQKFPPADFEIAGIADLAELDLTSHGSAASAAPD